MQSTNSEYGSPYLAVYHVTFTFIHRSACEARRDFSVCRLYEDIMSYYYIILRLNINIYWSISQFDLSLSIHPNNT